MILQELCSFYDRLEKDSEQRVKISVSGWSLEKVSWVLVIDEAGKLLDVQPIGIPNNNKLVPREMSVPEHSGVRTSGIKPFFLCDKALYLLGVGGTDKHPAKQYFDSSGEFHRTVLDGCTCKEATAVIAYFKQPSQKDDLAQELIDELSRGGNAVFCLNSLGHYIHECPEIKKTWEIYYECEQASDNTYGWCSVTGEQSSLARLFPQVTGIPGAQSSGASLVSFNFDASKSYGKDQALNASISQSAAFKSGAALKYLLGNRDKRILLGDTIVIYWSDRPAPPENALVAIMLGDYLPAEDESNSKAIRRALDEMRRGLTLTEFDNNVGFCILGLSPNAARLSVRFFERSTLGKLAKSYGLYLQDTSMEGVDSLSLRQLLCQTAAFGKSENIPSTLVNRIFSSMLTDTEFPRSLKQLVLSRMRADHGNNNSRDIGQRAAVLKACRVRRVRKQGIAPTREEKIDMSLNPENTNVGYLMGRLFAVMERAQGAAIGVTNATIRDRFFSAASTTPQRALGSLSKGYSAHLGTLRKKMPGLAIILDRETGSIVELLPGSGELPATLDTDGQAAFFIGYYQEREHLWQKKDDKTENEIIDNSEEN